MNRVGEGRPLVCLACLTSTTLKAIAVAGSQVHPVFFGIVVEPQLSTFPALPVD